MHHDKCINIIYAYENNLSAGMLCDERSRPDPKEGIALSARTCDITTADSHKNINEK